MVHIAALESSPESARITMHLLRAAQIANLKQDEAPTKTPSKYTDYADVFFFDLAMELPEKTGINKYTIRLQDGKHPLCRLIYSLSPVELENLKTYLETYLKTRFI